MADIDTVQSNPVPSARISPIVSIEKSNGHAPKTVYRKADIAVCLYRGAANKIACTSTLGWVSLRKRGKCFREINRPANPLFLKLS